MGLRLRLRCSLREAYFDYLVVLDNAFCCYGKLGQIAALDELIHGWPNALRTSNLFDRA